MERIYINLGKNDGFYAGNLIDMLNKNIEGPRVDVGRIDLMPGYSLFDIRKKDAQRVVHSLKGLDFMGKRVYSEVAEADKDYARAATRKARESRGADASNPFFDKKGRGAGRKSRKNSHICSI